MKTVAIKHKSRLIILVCNLLGGAGITLFTLLFPDGIFADLIRLTHATWHKQPKFGTFHIVALLLCLLLCVLICVFEKKLERLQTDSIIFAIGIIFFWLEIYKQLYYITALGNGYYNFGIFPLQLCSYVIYLFPIIPLLNVGRIKNALYSFCALYLTLGGAIVMIYPYMFIQVPLAIHTVLWHTLMVGAGVLLLKRIGIGKSYAKEILPATVVFLGTLTVAIAFNWLLTPLSQNSEEPLNLFYLSPYQQNSYILIGDVQRAHGWLASVVCYAVLAVIGASLLWLVCKVTLLFNHKKRQGL
jgi:hypothetical protein